MKSFATLFRQLEETNKTNEKVAALIHYLDQVNDEDRLWTIALFSHRRPKRTVTTTLLRTWASEMAGIPLWLFEESYHIVGDLAETISLVLPTQASQDTRSLSSWIQYIKDLKDKEESEKKAAIYYAWTCLNKDERFLFNKLITGGFRVGISQKLMTRALSKHLNKAENEIAHRLMGNWTPENTNFHDLLVKVDILADRSKPYPFYLAYALESTPESLGKPEEWYAEWKWDGIRGQIIHRSSEAFIWSRGEELISHQFPELVSMIHQLPEGTVIDGEILPYKDDQVLRFNDLQKRLGRKKVSKKLLEEAPIILMAYDLLEWNHEDIRDKPFEERRKILDQLVAHQALQALKLSPIVPFEQWAWLQKEREKSRSLMAEGFMLKRKNSAYLNGRKKGDWWKWKVDPYSIDAVMIYAQRGHGRRSSLYTDFTFALWDGDQLVTFAKAYSGLTDAEFNEITKFVRNNTIERFGPVSSVKAELVFEIAFEGIQISNRHKSGVALRFPRIKRWRKDKKAVEADTLDNLKKLLN